MPVQVVSISQLSDSSYIFCISRTIFTLKPTRPTK